MESKYKGVDQRQIKCCDKAKDTIEAGISFENNQGQDILNFHFLEYINLSGKPILIQRNRSMWLNKENVEQLIEELQEINKGLSKCCLNNKCFACKNDKCTMLHLFNVCSLRIK